MPKYKAALFDIDDTLLKTREPKWRQHMFVAKKYYGVDLTEEALRENWGKPFDELAAVLYQGEGTAGERRANFTRHELEFSKEYEPHAPETIERLHNAGVVLGLMTAMFMQGAMIDLENLRLPLDYFVVQQGSEATEYHKPDGRVFDPALLRLKELGIARKDTVYIGEALDDLEAARDAQLDFIAITQGSASEKDFKIAGASVVFDNLKQVTGFILEN